MSDSSDEYLPDGTDVTMTMEGGVLCIRTNFPIASCEMTFNELPNVNDPRPLALGYAANMVRLAFQHEATSITVGWYEVTVMIGPDGQLNVRLITIKLGVIEQLSYMPDPEEAPCIIDTRCTAACNRGTSGCAGQHVDRRKGAAGVPTPAK